MSANDMFRLSLDQWAEKAGDKLDALGRVSIQDLCEAVVDDTPLDTGFLVGNWQPSLKPPGTDVVAQPEEFEGKKGSEADKGRANAKMSGIIPKIKAGVIFWMTNNANYARYQEYGTSRMTGRLFVQRNMARWRAIVDNAAKKIGLAK